MDWKTKRKRRDTKTVVVGTPGEKETDEVTLGAPKRRKRRMDGKGSCQGRR